MPSNIELLPASFSPFLSKMQLVIILHRLFVRQNCLSCMLMDFYSFIYLPFNFVFGC